MTYQMAAGLSSVKFKNGLAMLPALFLRDEETYNPLFFFFPMAAYE